MPLTSYQLLGTTLIIAPSSDALAVHAAIPGAQADGQGGFTVPCNTKASVALTFGKRAFKINPVDIAFQPLDPNDPNGDCVSGIGAGNVGGAQEWLVSYFSATVTSYPCLNSFLPLRLVTCS
jgi:hypothetical protein